MHRSHLSARPGGCYAWSVRRTGCAALAGLIAFVAGGCQSYERRPLDVAGHHAAFLARTPQSPEVRAFARTLFASSATPSGAVAPGFDPADGISIDEAEVIALVFNADLRLARLRAGVTRATADNSGLWEDPTIGVDLARVVNSTPEPWKVFGSLGLTIPLSGRLETQQQLAGVEHAAELARVTQHEWRVRMSVRRAWSEWSALDTKLAATRDFLARVEQVLVVVDKMEQAGEIARTEARLFRIERATKAAELGLLEAQAREGELRLRHLMGMSPDAPLQLEACNVWDAGTLGQSRGEPAELAYRSPALLVAAAEYDAAEKALELEIREQYPDLHIGPGFGSEDGEDQVLLGLSVPVPILNANRRGIAEATAQRDVARATVEGTLEQIIAAITAAQVRLAAAIRRRDMLETEIVPLVDAQYADAREVARLGEVNTLVLLESLTRQHEAKIGLLEATRDASIAAVDLREIIGTEAINGPSTGALPHAPDNSCAGHFSDDTTTQLTTTGGPDLRP